MPEFEDPKIARQVDIAQTALLPPFAASLLYAVVAPFLRPGEMLPPVISLAGTVALGLAIAAARKGYPRAAGLVGVFLYWLVATQNLLLAGGLSAPGNILYFPAILLAAFLDQPGDPPALPGRQPKFDSSTSR
ncbi:MAG: hypothetical protein CL908_22270 [Deltaproteobacteria bacterium]|nr:hypothetical protein [Deltaproteobacteria bacterium]